MYENEAMTGATVGYPAERNPDAPISLFPTLEDAYMQLEKLHALISEVLIKAAPLMREETETAIKMDAAIMVQSRPQYASPAAEKADAIVASIRSAQSKIARLARELDA